MSDLFNGSDYVPERDDARLLTQLDEIRDLMLDGQWRSLNEIESITGHPPASISAQLRHLRKERFGSYTVEKTYKGNGLYLYRVTKQPLTAGETGITSGSEPEISRSNRGWSRFKSWMINLKSWIVNLLFDII